MKTEYTTAPFDLEKALAGHPLVTRIGHDVSHFQKHEGGTGQYPWDAHVDGYDWQIFTRAGRFFESEQRSDFDLFLKIEAPSEPDYTCPQYQASILLAYAEGKQIEGNSNENPEDDGWIKVDRPDYFRRMNYRVALERPTKPRCIHSALYNGDYVQLTGAVCAALDDAGVEYEKGGDQ